ncbi:LuxR C-terminal-related transcriptional regulator [Candidatus Finniella inopinata]|uniref:LuxR C-terminal-related transcriptional regulator n=1 Tax=Candidatus Finniella inopinata TaxID=1696036 RepID=UPI0013EE8E2C|nr:LuxR C-terminal-related transcriptional regulator [Candidatus Finniella inopinata]
MQSPCLFSATDTLMKHPTYRKQMEIALSCNMENRVVFYQRFKDYCEISIFGSSFHDTAAFCNFCIQNLSVLQNFVKYFRSQAKSLIEAANEDPILLDPCSSYKILETNLLNFVGYNFKEKRKITLQLTEQEANSLELLASGKTVEEVAKNLQLSSYIVKSHIGEMIKKSECQSIYGLLKIFPTLAPR